MNPALNADNANPPGEALEDAAFRAEAQRRLDLKTKPPGSLGKLETAAVQLACIQRSLTPRVTRKRICVFAASHGVTAAGVSAYPAEVTRQMVLNFLEGGAAINVLARHGAIELHVIDAGVDAGWPEALVGRADFFIRKARHGTRNFLNEPAMTATEREVALEAGREQARLAFAGGIQLLGIGEMGIGNTTAASALLAALLGMEARDVVGRGTGVSDQGLERKVDAVARALRRYRATCASAHDWLEAVGGYEIAAMTGLILEASALGLPVVVDGFIATAAAAAAFRLEPSCCGFCFFSHRSRERAHRAVLNALAVEPLLDLGLCLGEGTGSALAMHLIDAAAKVMCDMATFESASVSGRAE
ncbi:MAG: nicotinate-nucleotide--dimethylbenzimidazole phosphoribosyltransferase [Verrucomicrobia bacterium]|nr:nicotinate-nucleotide--dimethylbenzimidazole phosphoribosyltransferase [Verrucomicrobiota bacterium]